MCDPGTGELVGCQCPRDRGATPARAKIQGIWRLPRGWTTAPASSPPPWQQTAPASRGEMHPLRAAGGLGMNSKVCGTWTGTARAAAPLARIHSPKLQSCETVRALTSFCAALRGQRGGGEEASAGSCLKLPTALSAPTASTSRKQEGIYDRLELPTGFRRRAASWGAHHGVFH